METRTVTTPLGNRYEFDLENGRPNGASRMYLANGAVIEHEGGNMVRCLEPSGVMNHYGAGAKLHRIDGPARVGGGIMEYYLCGEKLDSVEHLAVLKHASRLVAAWGPEGSLDKAIAEHRRGVVERFVRCEEGNVAFLSGLGAEVVDRYDHGRGGIVARFDAEVGSRIEMFAADFVVEQPKPRASWSNVVQQDVAPPARRETALEL